MATQEERVNQLEKHRNVMRRTVAGLLNSDESALKDAKFTTDFTDIEGSIDTLRTSIDALSMDIDDSFDAAEAIQPTLVSVSGDTFSIAHGLGYHPIVSLLNSSGEDITYSGILIAHTSANVIDVSGAGPAFAGTLVYS